MDCVCVHLGAGYHSAKKLHVYKELCLKACKEGMKVLEETNDSVAAVTATVTVLEDSPLTNAGTGSNLTTDGSVECDAGLMEARSLKFAGVGAAAGVRNPIQVAKMMLDEQKAEPKLRGKKNPCLLAGPGVSRWAVERGMMEVHPSQLITEEAIKERKKSLKLLTQAREQRSSQEAALDTVGAVCVDSQGNAASAVSSGGILLKASGRVGHAACFACGCWAQTYCNSADESCTVAASTSGCGEDLMRVSLAKQCCDTMATAENQSEAIVNVFRDQFLESPFLSDVPEKLGGAVILKCDQDVIELSLAHTTPSFIVAYQTRQHTKAKVLVSRCNDEKKVGTSVTVQGEMINLRKKRKCSDP
ncbi:threonine aspartase 1-like isoform X3 [Apostichopus japonicus]|uniref:threonine aspartase 1-like isoform X2 n=1 Tax=Stichopus japonicus TaxID=307972 RepID=UPI003AB34526